MSGAQAMKRLVFGSRRTIAGTVDGTIVVLAAMTAGAKAFEHDLWRLAAIVVTTVLVLWVAHVYADGLGGAATLAAVALNLCLGLAIVALKILVAH